MIIQNSEGHAFLDFYKIDEKNILEGQYDPLTHSLLIIKYENKILVVFDRWKNIWELPGGSIKKTETPRECALRELKEETNQEINNLVFKGIMKFQLKPDNRIEYGALYYGELNNFIPFNNENEEIKNIKLWDKKEIIKIDEIDEKLLDFC